MASRELGDRRGCRGRRHRLRRRHSLRDRVLPRYRRRLHAPRAGGRGAHRDHAHGASLAAAPGDDPRRHPLRPHRVQARSRGRGARDRRRDRGHPSPPGARPRAHPADQAGRVGDHHRLGRIGRPRGTHGADLGRIRLPARGLARARPRRPADRGGRRDRLRHRRDLPRSAGRRAAGERDPLPPRLRGRGDHPRAHRVDRRVHGLRLVLRLRADVRRSSGAGVRLARRARLLRGARGGVRARRPAVRARLLRHHRASSTTCDCPHG